MEDINFVEIEVVTPKLNDTGRSDVNPVGINSRIHHITEIHNATVKEELFETPLVGSTRESINTNTNNKSRSKKIPALKVATRKKQNSLMVSTERREGEKFPNRSAASTSENVTKRRYQTRSASGMTTTWQLKEHFLFKDKHSEEKFDNDVFFWNGYTTKAERVELTLERLAELEPSPLFGNVRFFTIFRDCGV